MLKIGEFSKLALTTVAALRYYEKEGLLLPAAVDKWTGYRYYETEQLERAARIRALRGLELSIDDIRAIFAGADAEAILRAKAAELRERRERIDVCLSAIETILQEERDMYQATVKEIPEMIVYSSEKRLAALANKMTFIPECGRECLRLNPDMKCAEPPYEFVEYLDEEFRETDVLIRHSEAVTHKGRENERIRFRTLPAAKVLSIFHKGPYEQLGDAYAYIFRYAEENGYEVAGNVRECYIDGIWNKESPEDWLTEIQLPIR